MRHHSTEDNSIGATTRSYTLSAPPVGLLYYKGATNSKKEENDFFLGGGGDLTGGAALPVYYIEPEMFI